LVLEVSFDGVFDGEGMDLRLRYWLRLPVTVKMDEMDLGKEVKGLVE